MGIKMSQKTIPGFKVHLGQNISFFIGLLHKNIGFYRFIWHKIVGFYRFSSDTNVPAIWKFILFYYSKVISAVFQEVYCIVHTPEYTV